LIIVKPRKQEYKQRARSNLEEYDLLVLGGGTGGKLVAWTLAQDGMKTAWIERKYVGGWGCGLAWSPPPEGCLC